MDIPIHFLVLLSFFVTQSDTDILPPSSVACVDEAQAVGINPSGLGQIAGWEARGYYSVSENALARGGGAYMAWRGLGLGYLRRENGSTSADVYSVSYGRRVAPGLGLGAGYHDINGTPVWDTGVLVRPSRFLSLGGRIWDVWRVPFYTLGAALRPLAFNADLEDRFTAFADYGVGQGQGRWLFGLSVEALRGVGVFSSMRRMIGPPGSWEVQAGVVLNFSHVGLGSSGRVLDGTGYGGQVSMVRLSQAEWPTVLKEHGRYLDLSIEGSPPEKSPSPLLPLLTGERKFSHLEMIRTIAKASRDPAVAGMLISLRGADLGMGRIQELRGAVASFRGAGKKVTVYIQDASPKDYYLAAAADEVVIHPASHLDLVGLYARAMFFRGSLEKLGVETQFESRGKYKSAPESFTRTGMSPASREEAAALLDDLFGRMTEDIARDRHVDPQVLRAMIDRGPFTPEDALKEKLVDAALYEDQVREKVGTKKFIEARGYGRTLRKNGSFRPARRIAVVFVTGLIAEGKNTTSLLGHVSGSDTITAAIRTAREDSLIDAIVLRVDSGGGSALASDDIRREIALTKGKKPVIVSMGDMAASGGYLVSVDADAIYVEPGSLTGSIGVFGGKISLDGLLTKLGVSVEVLRRGKHADVYSIHRPLDSEETAALARHITLLYEGFKKGVSEGRKLTPEKTEAAAQGRVWTGAQAKERGLVDSFGGIAAALEAARAASGIGAGEEIHIMELPRETAPLIPLSGSVLSWAELRDLVYSLANTPLYLVPYWLEFP